MLTWAIGGLLWWFFGWKVAACVVAAAFIGWYAFIVARIGRVHILTKQIIEIEDLLRRARRAESASARGNSECR